jgi:hypothetical protein
MLNGRSRSLQAVLLTATAVELVGPFEDIEELPADWAPVRYLASWSLVTKWNYPHRRHARWRSYSVFSTLRLRIVTERLLFHKRTNV